MNHVLDKGLDHILGFDGEIIPERLIYRPGEKDAVTLVAKREAQHFAQRRHSVCEKDKVGIYRYHGAEMPVDIFGHCFPQLWRPPRTFAVADILGGEVELKVECINAAAVCKISARLTYVLARECRNVLEHHVLLYC